MSDEGDNNFIRYVYRGEENEHIPDDVTHVTVGKDVTVILCAAFFFHRKIVEVICHENVKKIEGNAFVRCPSLRRVIMPGVTVVEYCAFAGCWALTDVECGKLEIIGEDAFNRCKSLKSINLPSARIVEEDVFILCASLTDVKFGSKLERIDGMVFASCTSLERITIPLKDGLIDEDNIFKGCDNLKQVDLIERKLHETVAALQREEWRNDMNEEIDSINQILPNTYAGDDSNDEYAGGKTRAIRRWIRSVLEKINRYKAQHQLLLKAADTTLQLVLPQDIVKRNVLPFLALPSYTDSLEKTETEPLEL